MPVTPIKYVRLFLCEFDGQLVVIGLTSERIRRWDQRMGKLGTIIFLCVCALAAGWFWQQNQGCEYPLRYRVGEVDDRFNLSTREYRKIIQKAGDIWQRALGRELFVYDPAASFAINLIYDERQHATITSQELSRKMQQTESSNRKVRAWHDHWQSNG